MLARNPKVQKTAMIAVLAVILVGLSGWSVEVSLLSTPKEGSPGSFVTHVFAIANDSAIPQTYSLDFAAPAGWGLLGAPTSIALQPDEEGTLFVTITIPSAAEARDYNVTLTVVSQSDPLDQGVSSGIVSVAPRNEIELLAPTGASIAPGHAITYEFVLLNRGNMQDSFTIAATSSLGLPVALSHTAVELAPQETLTFTALIEIPIGTQSGRDALAVIAKSALFESVDADAVVFTTVLPPAPDAVGGTVMEELPARIRLSIDKNVMTGVFDSQLTFSTSGQILGGYFSSFFSLLDPFGPSLAEISSFSMLYRRSPITFSIGNVSQSLTDLLRLSCTGGSLKVDSEYYDLSIIGGGSSGETRFAGHFALGPDVANVGIGYLGIRDGLSVSESIWTATAHAEPLEDWTLTLEGSLGLDGPLTSRALFFNTTIDASVYFFSGSAFSVGTYFPGQRADSAGIEVSQRLRLDALSLSASLSHEWDNVVRDPLEQTRIQDDLGFNLSTTPLEDGPTLSTTIDFSWDRYADLSLKSDLSTLFSASMTETGGPFPYSLSGKVLEQMDHVLGSHVRSTTYAQGVGLSVDDFYLFFQMTENQSLNVVTDTPLSSSSDFSLRFRPETALHEASITFRNTLDDFDLSASLYIQFTDDLDIVFDGSISWDRHDSSAIGFGWGIAFNANVALPLPFLVTKGRIEGRAFIDRDGDGLYGLNDDPAGTIVIGAGQSKVSTDADGYFRFPPFYPGSVGLSAEELPLDAAAGAPIPVEVIAGVTIWIDVALAPVSVLTGEVFEDSSKDGMRDADEGGFSQVRVTLQSSADGSIVDAITDLSGNFSMTDILPGSYTLSVDANSLPERFEFTTAQSIDIVIAAQPPAPISWGGFVKEREVIITLQPPTADFTYAPTAVVAGMAVAFDGTDSFDFDGTIVSYGWDFNSDRIIDSTQSMASFTFQQPGNFDVALTVTDDSGNEDTVITSVTVSQAITTNVSFQPPIAEFFYMPAGPKTGETVLFNGSSSSDFDGAITAYVWDFNEDGEPDATASVASHIFLTPGTVQVSLRVTDDGGNTDSVSYPIVISGAAQPPSTAPSSAALPIADFQFSPTAPAPGVQITLNGTSSLDLDGVIVAFAWDFGSDGVIDSSSPLAQTSFGEAGTFSITLTVTDNDGNTDTITRSVTVAGAPQPVEQPGDQPLPQTDVQPVIPGVVPPIADFAYLPANPDAGAIILFNGTLSSDLDGRIVSFSWDFDADGVEDSHAAIVDHRYPDDGIYPVSLTVTDDSGSSDTITLQVVIGDGGPVAPVPAPVTQIPPIADFEYSPANPQTGSLVLFNGTLSTDLDGRIATYRWDFDGDGSADSTAAIAEYTYIAVGSYDASLTVTDNAGGADTLTLQIDVQAQVVAQPPAVSLLPLADFEFSPTEPSAGELVLFNGLVSTDPDGEIIAYAWDFDGDTLIDSTEGFAEHVFADAGTYNVSLTVTDDSDGSDTFTQVVLVEFKAALPPSPPSSFQPPVADFSYMPSHPTAGELVLFNGTLSWDFDGEIVAYSWDFNNDGSRDADTAFAEHFFPTPGSITVSLTVTDDSGASDTLSIPIEVE